MVSQSIVKMDSVVEVNENHICLGEHIYLLIWKQFHFKWQEQRKTKIKNPLGNIYQS